MPSRKLRRNENNLRFTLFVKQPWLCERDRENALEDLFDLCTDMEEQSLLCELLHRFEFLDHSRRCKLLRKMVEHIVESYCQENTQVVASAIDTEADSSQSILQALKPEFARAGWDRVQTTSHLGKSVKRLATHSNVVIVDEFVGTGSTMLKRVRDISQDYKLAVDEGRAPKDYAVHVCAMVGMEQGMRRLQDRGVDAHAHLILKKGISSYYRGLEMKDACKRMLRLESELAQNVNEIEIPSFGYGKSQALYGSDENTPNNVFPIFWWSTLNNGRRRRLLLHRSERANK